MAPGGGILVSALLVAAGATAARGPAIRVDFDAPAGCSDAEAFRRGVLARLDRAGDAELIATTRIEVRIRRAENRVQGELRLVHPPGVTDTRTVEGRSCDEVAGVLALTAALALQRPPGAPPRAPPPRGATPRTAPSRETTARAPAAATARAATRDATPVPTPAREGPASPPPARVPESRPTAAETPSPPADENPGAPPPPPPILAPLHLPTPPAAASVRAGVVTPPPPLRRSHVEIGAAAAAGRLLAPGLNLGGSVMLGVTRTRPGGLARSLRVSALYLPQDLLRPAGEVATTWIGGALTACPGWGLGRDGLAAELCARTVAGWVSATDRAVTNPRSAGRTWWGAGALLRGSAALGAGLTLELEAGVDAVLIERRFITTTPLRTVATTPPASVLVGIGLSRRL